MATRSPKRWWRISRACLRGLRTVILLLLLFLVLLLTGLNTIGLPGFLKRPLIAQLHARGLDLEFSRMRWRWNRGLVADNVSIGAAQQETNRPQLSVRQLAIEINHHALVRLKLHIDAVSVQGGELVWPLDDTNRPDASLAITNIQTHLSFLPGDQWTLDHFTAGFAGAALQLSGTVTNANALRDWKVFHKGARAEPGRLNQRLRQFADVIQRIQFTQPPQLNVIINGDARDPGTFEGLLTLDAKGALTPWGTLSNGNLHVSLIAPTGSNNLPTVRCKLHADEAKFVLHPDSARTLSGDTRQFQLNLEAAADETSTNVIRARLELSANDFNTPWAQGTNAHFTAHWDHSLTNPIPMMGTGELQLENARTRWGDAEHLQVSARLSPALDGPRQADASWAWWAALEPYALDWNCRVENVHAEEFKSSEVFCGGNWRAPVLTVTNLHTEMYQGRFDANAVLNVVTRQARFACVSDFDVLKALPLLPTNGSTWIQDQQFAWEKPPLLRGSGAVTLPAWTNTHPDWRGEVLPTLAVSGDFKSGAGSYRKIPLNSAQSHIYFTNQTWNLPDLVAIRPEGKVELSMVSDEKTRDYYFRFRTTVDVRSARHLLTTNVQQGLDSVTFTQPPLIDGELWGHWRSPEKIGFKGQITVTNFVARGAAATHFHTTLEYTNLFLDLKNARLERTNEYMSASFMRIDFQGRRAFVTNGFSTMEPMVLLRAIGPKVAHDIEPYHFLKPPVVKAYGMIPLSGDISVADLHFIVDGGPFEWMNFHLPHVSGNVDWVGELLTLSQIQGTFYEGKITGSAGFDFKPKHGTKFHFDTIVTGSNLRALMMDLVPGTNHLEGTFNGHLSITEAHSAEPKSWFGKGALDLHDGLIWDIPIFGILTPVLDTISPGLGKTRASEAFGTFVITNSVIRSEDLEIRSPTIRLFYKGTVDFDRNVNAIVEAEVGRDAPVFGTLFGAISTPFGKLFETRVTGNLQNPKRQAVVPFIRWLSPSHWWHSFHDIFSGGESDSNNPPNPPRK